MEELWVRFFHFLLTLNIFKSPILNGLLPHLQIVSLFTHSMSQSTLWGICFSVRSLLFCLEIAESQRSPVLAILFAMAPRNQA